MIRKLRSFGVSSQITESLTESVFVFNIIVCFDKQTKLLMVKQVEKVTDQEQMSLDQTFHTAALRTAGSFSDDVEHSVG